MTDSVTQPEPEITQDAARFLLRAAEYALDHLTGGEDEHVLLALRTAVAKATGND